MQKKVILTVINDLTQDQRLHKVCSSLKKNGYHPILVGTNRPKSIPIIDREYETKRLKVYIQKGPLAYIEFNIRLLFFLIFQKFDIVTANDLDTLMPCYMASKLKGKKIIYDSHEYFTEQPELAHRPTIKKIWTTLEAYLFPKLSTVITVNQSLSEVYSKKYAKKVHIIRNLPYKIEHISNIEKKKIVIYQGNINLSRGIEIMLKALSHLKDVEFWCVGPGDLLEEMIDLSKNLNVYDKVKFWGLIPFQDLKTITLQSAIGISIEQPIGLNSKLCLPNKLLDYIQCRIPVIVTDLPEMKQLVNKYKVGIVLETCNEIELAKAITTLLSNRETYELYKTNCDFAAQELCWENEEKTLLDIYSTVK